MTQRTTPERPPYRINYGPDVLPDGTKLVRYTISDRRTREPVLGGTAANRGLARKFATTQAERLVADGIFDGPAREACDVETPWD